MAQPVDIKQSKNIHTQTRKISHTFINMTTAGINEFLNILVYISVYIMICLPEVPQVASVVL